MIETVGMLIDADEPSYGMNVGEDEQGFYTRILVCRADVLVSAEIRHGKDEEYAGKVPPMFVPSPEGENPVGLMLQMSEAHRHDLRWYNRALEMKASSTLIADVIRQDEEARYAIRSRSVFGPMVTKQRNGYSRGTTEREWWDERAERTGKRTL